MTVSRRDLAYSDPLIFAREYLPHHVPAPFGPHHREMNRAVKDNRTGKRYAWGAPRGHAKSTLMSLVVPLWWACNEHKRYILQVADTSHQAEMFLAAIITEIEENARLSEDYNLGPAVDNKGQPVAWRDREIVLNNGVTIAAYGAGKAIRGAKKGENRPDAVVVDDLENDEHVRTAEQRDKLDQWFLRALMNLGDQDTDYYVLGTVLHHDSVLARKLEDHAWTSKIWRAIQDDGVSVLWPEKWSLAALQEKQSAIGSIAFAAEYQNDPTSMGAGIFKDAWFKFYSKQDISRWSVFAGVDLAISKKETADYSAVVKVATDGEEMRVLDVVQGRWSFKEAAQNIKDICGDCDLVGIESNAYQVAMAEELMFTSKLPVQEIHAHKDKVTRAITLSAFVEKGRVKFDRHSRDQQELMRQMLDFPMGAHDDLVDALGYAVVLATEYGAHKETAMTGASWSPFSEGY